ncbi:MAG: DUF3015 family protein [Nitrospirales bacterium]
MIKKSYSFIVIPIIAFAMSACSLIDATTDTTTQVTDGVTHATTDILSSTTPSSSDDSANNRVKKVRKFAKYNFINLQQDIAQGRGEYMTSLETLMGVPSQNREEFALFAQANYESFFGSDYGTSEQLLAQLAQFGSEEIRQALIFQVATK